jgi:hypothetical protein
MRIAANFASSGKRLQAAAHRLERFQSAYAEHREDACDRKKKARQQKTARYIVA